MDKIVWDLSGTWHDEVAMNQHLTNKRENVHARFLKDGKHDIRSLIGYVDFLERTISNNFSTQKGFWGRRGLQKLHQWERHREENNIWQWIANGENLQT